MLATDSRATRFGEKGERKHFSLKKLLRLTSHCALLSAGAGIGVEMSLAFQDFLQRRGAEAVEEVAHLALFFFTDRYGKWLSGRGRPHASSPLATEETSEEELPLNEVYLILAGYSFRDRVRPYPLHLFSSEGEGTSIKALPTSHTIVVPRSLSMEKKLEAQRQTGHPSTCFSPCPNPFSRKGLEKGRKLGHPSFLPSSLHQVTGKWWKRR